MRDPAAAYWQRAALHADEAVRLAALPGPRRVLSAHAARARRHGAVSEVDGAAAT
ncbi:MAG TPA: hypothetical protein VFY71_06160 [Planctomycetota bacterium]|nr:hypothetical protein [Planctomycetota bacterium]